MSIPSTIFSKQDEDRRLILKQIDKALRNFQQEHKDFNLKNQDICITLDFKEKGRLDKITVTAVANSAKEKTEAKSNTEILYRYSGFEYASKF